MKFPFSLLPALLLQAGLLRTCLSTGVEVHDGTWQPEYLLVATFEDITINCEQRSSVVFNGTSPGPPIYLTEGKTTWIRVRNDMPDRNLTMHWHGLTMRTAPFSDGTPLVSQWPIAPGEYFDYALHPEAGDAGSYFYHSHVGFQAGTARGMLYVQDCEAPPYEYDDDFPLMFGDYYRKSDADIEAGLLAIPFQWSGEPDSMVLNDRTGNSSFDDALDDSCKPYVFTVQPGKTYRLRFVGAMSLAYIQVAIDGHSNLTIINADGHYTKPATTGHIQLGAGQRFDALLTTKTREELDADGTDQYWLRYESRGRPTDLGGYALLQYDTGVSSNSTAKFRRNGRPHSGGTQGQHGQQGSGVRTPPGKFPQKPPVTLPADGDLPGWMEYTLEWLKPTEEFPTLSEVTRTIYITVNQHVVDGDFVNGSFTGSLIWEQNNLTWTEMEADRLHYTPYLIEAYTTGATPDYDAAVAGQSWDPKTKAFPAKVGEVLDIVWLSNSGPTGGFEFHPMHAHGEHYWDLGSGNGTYDAVANEERFGDYTPMKRDTTMLNRYAATGQAHTTAGWKAWRIRVTEDNVGAWMMHCHILQHMVMGMQTVWVFGDATAMLKEIPQPYIEGYLDFGGSAYGNDTYDPLVLTYFDE